MICQNIQFSQVNYYYLIFKLDLLKNIFFGGTKKPLRKIKDIINCGFLSNKMFSIEIDLNDGKNKLIIYEVKSINTRNEIVAKIKYLIVRILF